MALAIRRGRRERLRGFGERLQLRIGVHNSGALIAAWIGTHKFVYDVWCDTVNTANDGKLRAPGRIHVRHHPGRSSATVSASSSAGASSRQWGGWNLLPEARPGRLGLPTAAFQRAGRANRLFAPISRSPRCQILLAIGFQQPRHSGIELAPALGHNRWQDDDRSSVIRAGLLRQLCPVMPGIA